jgi:hypothetical protein
MYTLSVPKGKNLCDALDEGSFFTKKGRAAMEEKTIETRQEAGSEGKKPYTPPALTVYGKLVELTAGGSNASGEPGSSKVGNRKT